MRKFTLLLAVIIGIFLSGCNSKRQYFEPESTDGAIKFKNSLPSTIKHTNINGATLDNGNIITKNGLNTNVKLKEGFKFLGENGGNIISASLDGELDVSDTNGNQLFLRKFPTAIVSASLENNLLAAVSAANHIYLLDIYTAETLMEYKSSEIYSVDSRVAAPKFLNTIIVYPSLDGRVYITQKSGQIIRDIVISSENFFNNVIFVDVVDENLIAATAKKVMIVNPQKTNYYNGEIKTLVRDGKYLFIFEKDGSIVKADFEFNKLAKKYFKFAIFSDAVVVADKLYAVEKTGYVVQTDLNLENAKILELDSELEDKSFLSNDTFFYDKESVKFQ